ncbi:hypothetical protein PBY51_015224 [Eleginops maclovinus]|uniref:TNFR-Cys domain-containing protein n=1 Tax=Eleginops maclovinus TaxID=56733 RepID=A0AAN8ABR7_ELEMC|nr:hypothetical protein PBY51_015224 [Eleginops maclovinus]
MVAADSSKFPSWVFIAVLVFLLTVDLSSAQGELQQCVDGTYEHEGATCCLCGAGTFVERHCTTSQPRICTNCAERTYSSHPHYQESCEPCTSCSHTNANLEVDEPCTRARDATCRCKKDHFCSIGKETCRICYLCKKCTDGVKVACTATNDTVCNDKIEGGTNTGMIAGIIVPIVLILIGLLVFIWIRKHNRKGNNTPDEERNGGPAGVLEDLSLKEPLLALGPNLPDIANIIGWKTMKDVAIRSCMLETTIENCKLNHVGDVQEQTLQLLQEFVQKEGGQALTTLIQNMKNGGHRKKAEMVIAKLTPPT